jgi:uncharacterized protein YjbI with pentapeptide repeats
MNVKNLTPFLFGPKVTSRRPPRPEMALIVRACFAIEPNAPLTLAEDQGVLTADTFGPDDEERRGECLHASDFADYKPRTDVMLRGTCHTPHGEPLEECPVRFAVGGWSKTLRVVGRRFWSDERASAVMSRAMPFTTMPVDYAHAFGGEGYEPNPAGKGITGPEGPNVEQAAAPIRSRRDRPGLAGFGPINPAWRLRAAKVGTQYGKSYKETRAPYYAEDFDWAYFNAAPPDQQLAALRGDEELVFHNLHPTSQVLATRLPGLRLRAFVEDVGGRFREVKMILDTLFADLDASHVYLTWRGLDGVAEDDLSDVATVLVASESLADAPRAVEDYRDQLVAFAADPTGIKAATPEGFGELAERLDKERAGEASADEPGVGSTAGIPKLLKSLGARKAAKTLDPASASAPQVSAKVREVASADVAPPLVPFKPGSMPPMRLKGRIADALGSASQGAGPADRASLRTQEAASSLRRNRLLRSIPEIPAPRLPLQEPGPGHDLSGQDLTGRDLRGCDLRGAVLEGTILTRANLRGADLRGARLKYAVLYRADLSLANLSGADLTMAQLSRAIAHDAVFADAVVEEASFEKADLTGASLERVKGHYVRLSRATLSRIKAARCSLTSSLFEEAVLDGADFTGADLSRGVFLEAHGHGVVMNQALLDGATFASADLGRASFQYARGNAVLFMKARLEAADLRCAWLPGAQLTEVSADRAVFSDAQLKGSRLYRATMEGASFARANLCQADFSKAKLTRVLFTGANLYDAKFVGASGKGCDFVGANLKRSTLEAARW